MSNEITKPSISGSLVPAELLQDQSKFADELTFNKMAGAGFMPRVQLTAGLSRVVSKGKAKIGTYLMLKGKEEIVRDFGDTFSCLVLGWRPKALRIESATNKAFIYFNPKRDGFKAVEVDAEKKPRIKGCLYGPEYLVFSPEANELATMHFSNATMRNRAAEMKTLMGRAATLRVELIEANGLAWHGPIITPCSTPLNLPSFDSDEGKNLLERFRMAREKFNNPPDEEVEEVAEEVDGAATPGGERQR